MPHVTFIHGLSNKPEAEILHQIWRRALAKGSGGLNLGAEGVSSSMIYWADVLYPEPDTNVADYESASELAVEAVDGSGDAEIPVGENYAERIYIQNARERMSDRSDAEIEVAAAGEVALPVAVTESMMATAPFPGVDTPKLERIPLPWFIKKKIMAAYIRDAYLYQFNKSFSPRPGFKYEVQKEIRKRFVEALSQQTITHPHVVVSHSMGTMIAYDCLKRVAECPRIDGLITMGSPLGVDEVQDGFKPEWTRADGFPGSGLAGDWVNLFDRLDVVCAADPKLAGDFRATNAKKIIDTEVENDGAWRHSVVKYLARSETRKALRRLLGI
jgi:hypothetical protein